MMSEYKRKLFHTLLYPSIFILCIGLIHITNELFDTSNWLFTMGIYPRTIAGLKGILFAPLIHNNWDHFLSNTPTLFILMLLLFYFYRPIHFKIWALLYVVSGIWIWTFARPAYHIGASGLIYALSTFLFFSGIFRKEYKLMAISFLVVFLYGSLFMGMFPLEKNTHVSWESHLWGGVAGMFFAYWFRNNGPQKKKHDWSNDYLYANMEDDYNQKIKDEQEHQRKLIEEQNNIGINYIYKANEDKENNVL